MILPTRREHLEALGINFGAEGTQRDEQWTIIFVRAGGDKGLCASDQSRSASRGGQKRHREAQYRKEHILTLLLLCQAGNEPTLTRRPRNLRC